MNIEQLIARVRANNVSAATAMNQLEDLGYGFDNYWDAESSVYRVDESRAICIRNKDVRVGLQRCISIVVDIGKLVVTCDECEKLNGLTLDCPVKIDSDSEHIDALQVVEIVANYADLIPLDVDLLESKIVATVFVCE